MVRLNEIKQEELKSILLQEKPESKVINCRISKDRLVSKLDDGREISIAIDLLTKWSILGEKVKPQQLKKYELQNEGKYIYFPDIDEILPVWIIDKGLHASCLE